MKANVEVELKYDGSSTTPDAFSKAAEELIKELEAKYPKVTVYWDINTIQKALDTFYKVGEAVVRYRRFQDEPQGELTIKSRHSDSTMISRDEVDLPVLADGIQVAAFMGALGGKELFSLRKDYILFEIAIPGHDDQNYFTLDVVMYDAFLVNPKDKNLERRSFTKKVTFIEIEVGKESLVETEEAMEIVGNLGKKLSKKLKLGKPLNVSLFETFHK